MLPWQTEISRRTALVGLGASALGLALKNVPLFGEEAWSQRLRKVLPNFSQSSRLLLEQLLKDPQYTGMIPSKDAAVLAGKENISVDKLMVALIPLAQGYSQAPISNFYVGVVVRGASGNLYTGANIEIPGQCLGLAVHAEQSALSNAYMHGEEGVTALAVGGAPCGHCRQFIDEVSPDGEILILTPQQGPRKLSQILPEAFGPAALGMTHGALPVPYTNLASGGTSVGPEIMAALDAARRSYAPYSKSPSGASLRSTTGRIYRGSYIENVAFNPSLSPLQVALAALIAAGEDYSQISGAALVEAQDAKISQRAVTEIVLKAVAPSAKLFYSVATR